MARVQRSKQGKAEDLGGSERGPVAGASRDPQAAAEGTECLGCNLIETDPVTLTRGTVVCTSCPDWRMACEAREVLRKPLEARREYLDGVESARGKNAADGLKAAIKTEWERRK
jgi:hypothetical protein